MYGKWGGGVFGRGLAGSATKKGLALVALAFDLEVVMDRLEPPVPVS